MFGLGLISDNLCSGSAQPNRIGSYCCRGGAGACSAGLAGVVHGVFTGGVGFARVELSSVPVTVFPWVCVFSTPYAGSLLYVG
jgi:hypothetical protein